ncbi:MAG: NAD(P)H-hydrate dehydratase [Spirochaetales bacterium]|nr:NAD(P)H-hydrate dehydratase [Spirochaetales bacterium]
MKPLFVDTRPLDERARAELCLTSDILMENAAAALEDSVMRFLDVSCCCAESEKHSGLRESHGCAESVLVLIVCGSGDNGADGLVLARRLKDKVSGSVLIEPCVLQFLLPKSEGCKLQFERAKKIGVNFIDEIEAASDAAVIVDCLFGSGFHGTLDGKPQKLIEYLNSLSGYKIACDVPSALDCAIKGSGVPFAADETVTMGAPKVQLYLDGAKDYTEKIYTASLGMSDAVFEGAFKPDAFLLEKSDLKLPSRQKLNVHKGSFGHAALICGEKPGASIMAASAAMRFGAGLVTLVNASAASSFSLPYELMLSDKVPETATALAIGMGLGLQAEDSAPYLELLKDGEVPAVIDADLFYCKSLPQILEARSASGAKTILTPHPKEFAELLKNCGLADVSAADIQKDRLGYAKMLCCAYKDIVLILKGSTPIISVFSEDSGFEAFFNPHGSPVLAKGGSGDVLSGLSAALLAQGWCAKQAAVQASLAHALASNSAASKISSYAFTPSSLIEEISLLEKQI